MSFSFLVQYILYKEALKQPLKLKGEIERQVPSSNILGKKILQSKQSNRRTWFGAAGDWKWGNVNLASALCWEEKSINLYKLKSGERIEGFQVQCCLSYSHYRVFLVGVRQKKEKDECEVKIKETKNKEAYI